MPVRATSVSSRLIEYYIHDGSGEAEPVAAIDVDSGDIANE